MTRTTAYFRSEAQPILYPGTIAQKLNETNAKVMKQLDEFTNLGSALGVLRLYIWELYSINNAGTG